MHTESTVIRPDTTDDGSSSLQLLVMSPDSVGTFPVPESGEIQIGRSSRCDVRVEDPMASRVHAVLRAQTGAFSIEDLGSANGTKVRGEAAPAKTPIAIRVGDAIAIGTTILVLQKSAASVGPRRLWSHDHFRGRLEAACRRSLDPGETFAVIRVRLTRPAPWVEVVPLLAAEVRPPNVFASFGPRDYEVLAHGGETAASALVDALKAALPPTLGAIEVGISSFPGDGRSVDALLARAGERLQGRRIAPAAPARRGPRSPALERVYAQAAKVAGSTINVLVTGETGTGKEVLAGALHAMSPRASKRMLTVNCASLTESLIESELFGHEKGAFTGAVVTKVGLIEAAHESTLFLDEIGELPLSTQARLLRVLESREIVRVGSTKPRQVDVRFIAATNRDLERESSEGHFRRDLFFRLNGINLALPPLRERQEEILPLAREFLAHFAAEANVEVPRLTAEAEEWLVRYPWPGNIRELKNAIERASLLREGDEIGVELLPIQADERRGPAPRDSGSRADRSSDTGDERQRILDALARFGGNQSRTAKFLGMSRGTLISRLNRYGIARPQKHADDDTDEDDDTSD